MDSSTLQEVADELAIRNLLARVHHTNDAVHRGEATPEDFATCWTEDWIWESPSMGTYHGAQGHAVRSRSVGALAKEAGTMVPPRSDIRSGFHMTVTVEVRLDGDTAICHSKYLYGTAVGPNGTIHQVGRYVDEVRRTPKGWKLHHRRVFP